MIVLLENLTVWYIVLKSSANLLLTCYKRLHHSFENHQNTLLNNIPLNLTQQRHLTPADKKIEIKVVGQRFGNHKTPCFAKWQQLLQSVLALRSCSATDLQLIYIN